MNNTQTYNGLIQELAHRGKILVETMSNAPHTSQGSDLATLEELGLVECTVGRFYSKTVVFDVFLYTPQQVPARMVTSFFRVPPALNKGEGMLPLERWVEIAAERLAEWKDAQAL